MRGGGGGGGKKKRGKRGGGGRRREWGGGGEGPMFWKEKPGKRKPACSARKEGLGVRGGGGGGQAPPLQSAERAASSRRTPRQSRLEAGATKYEGGLCGLYNSGEWRENKDKRNILQCSQ